MKMYGHRRGWKKRLHSRVALNVRKNIPPQGSILHVISAEFFGSTATRVGDVHAGKPRLRTGERQFRHYGALQVFRARSLRLRLSIGGLGEAGHERLLPANHFKSFRGCIQIQSFKFTFETN
jgi:hypothetical protein